jgi:Rieske Fe-S protein
MFPVVSYGTPQKFLVPVEDLPEVGDELVFDDMKVVLRRQTEKEVAAISLVCTHLGCTVNRVETGFLCPCHGSQYDSDGLVVGGPAPKTLPWLDIKVVPGGQIEIDTGTALPENSFFAVV